MEIVHGLGTSLMDSTTKKDTDHCFQNLPFEDRLRGFCIFSVVGNHPLFSRS